MLGHASVKQFADTYTHVSPTMHREAAMLLNIERCVNRLKQWRRIATRYEKRAVNYWAAVVIAALMIWLTP